MISRAELVAAGQEHLADALGRLRGEARARLAAEIAELDLGLLARLAEGSPGGPAPPPDTLEPPDVVALPSDADGEARDREARAAGEEALRAGEVALVLLAGGQGTRLGFPGPKGCLPIGPVSGVPLFAHHAAKVAALRARHGADLPLYVMTSPDNDAATRAAFAESGRFGLAAGSVRVFVQGTLPAVDRESGRVLLAAPDRIAMSPDGHGGLLAALRRHGILDELAARGVRTVFTFQVDNPLVRIADARLIGHHRLAGAEMSGLVVRKRAPEERMGVVARLGERQVLVEYSDLPDELAARREPDGSLTFWAGSIAVHCLELSLVDRLTAGGDGLPLHRAIKPVPHVDDTGRPVRPRTPNAVKLERFLFDALPHARGTVAVEAARADEFSPVKNAAGDDSPATARRDLGRLHARWLERVGVVVPRDAAGEPAVAIEIDPRVSLEGEGLAERVPPGTVLDGPLHLAPEG